MHTGGFSCFRVNGDLSRYGVSAQGQISSVHGRIDQAGGGVECGVNTATALSFASAAAITAAAIFIVLEAVAGDTSAILGQDAAHFREAFFQRNFRAVQLCRSLEDAVWKIRQIFLHAGDAEV